MSCSDAQLIPDLMQDELLWLLRDLCDYSLCWDSTIAWTSRSHHAAKGSWLHNGWWADRLLAVPRLYDLMEGKLLPSLRHLRAWADAANRCAEALYLLEDELLWRTADPQSHGGRAALATT